MAYLVAADFRHDTLHEVCRQFELTEADAEDADITSAITRLSARFDDETNDHYESEALVLIVTGDETNRLYLPRRCTAVSQVRVRNYAGTWTVQTSTVYRLVSSLETGGARRRSKGALDYLEVLPYQYITGGTYTNSQLWPCEPAAIEVTGTFGWTTTPTDVKKAVAALVYDHFKPIRADLGLADRWQTEDASFNRSVSIPFGLPIVDSIVANFKHDPDPGVG